MKRVLSLIFILLSLNSYSQKMNISGSIFGPNGKTPLKNTMIMAVRFNDSLLLGHTRSDANGNFEISGFEIDTFSLIIKHPKYDEKTYYIFGHSENYEIFIPSVRLTDKAQEFEDIVIYTNKSPIFFRGDTLVYIADSFKVAENAVVEDLLKKLPGIEVDDQGKITSQGEDIDQVLVDGDEFFGSDNTIATKNLAAKGIDKVEIYDKRNEDASIGDDDEEIKVLDLKLKDAYKKGYFGKVVGASDFSLFEENPFYEGEFMFNKFSSKQKLSVYALGSNTPRSDLSWADKQKFGLSNNNSRGGGWNEDDPSNTSGIPRAFRAGVYFKDKFGKYGSIGFNYTYSKIDLEALSNSYSQYFLKDTTYFSRDSISEISKTESHEINLDLKFNIDSLTSVNIKPSMTYDIGENESNSFANFLNTNNISSLKTDILYKTKSTGLSSRIESSIKRKFKKPYRELKAKYIYTLSDNNTDESLLSYSNYTLPFTYIDSINQEKINNNGSNNHRGILTYVEPFGKKWKMELEYLSDFGGSNQERETYNFENGSYSDFDDSLSNTFNTDRQQYRFSAGLKYENRMFRISGGLAARNIQIQNQNLITGNNINQNINNLLPRFKFTYKPSKTQRVTLNYRTSSSQPSINDLQPVPDNTNPNNIKIGNPKLEPNYSNILDLRLRSWNVLSRRFMWAGASARFTNNAFADSTSFDNYGRTISMTKNVNGNISSSLYAGASFSFLSNKLSLKPNLNLAYSKYLNYINSLENETKTTFAQAGLTFGFNFDSLSFDFGGNYTYTAPLSSISSLSSRPFYTQFYSSNIEWRLPMKFKIKLTARYTINSNRTDGFNQNILIINSEISKSFLKTENIILSINGNDILNQNVTLDRLVTANVITDYYTNIISRYFLLKLTCKFNNNGTKEEEYKRW